MLFRERQQVIICVAAVAVFSGFVLLRYLPMRKSMSTIKSAHEDTKDAAAEATFAAEQMPVIKEQLRNMRQEVGNYDNNVPDLRNLGAFLQTIANLMNHYDLKEQVIEPNREIAADQLNCIPVEIKCKGRLTQIFEFYKSLQSMDRLVRIEAVKLTNDRDFGGEVSMQTKVVIYYKSQPQTDNAIAGNYGTQYQRK